MKFPKVFISAVDWTKRYRFYPVQWIYTLKILESLSDEELTSILDIDSKEMAELRSQVGHRLNPNWIARNAAYALRERGLITTKDGLPL